MLQINIFNKSKYQNKSKKKKIKYINLDIILTEGKNE